MGKTIKSSTLRQFREQDRRERAEREKTEEAEPYASGAK
jgi:hypothetical protein